MPSPTTVADAPSSVAVFPFDHDHGVPARGLADVLGGKGAGLAEMTTALGLPVPPGFTITVGTCRRYLAGGWPAELDGLVTDHVERLGRILGRRFGDPADPLLLAVRSGAPRSMPGMLDTVLNLGLSDETVLGLAAASGDERFAWDCYRRFVRMYATTVLGVDDLGEEAPADDIDALRAEIARVRATVEIPQDPRSQLCGAIEAVFRSCGSERALAYAQREQIDGALATAVNVQAMVFGNRGGESGTGVVFTRDPSTGEARRYGDYLPRAQGEDVVSGVARTQTIESLRAELPAIWTELDGVLDRLEQHYADICDVEFTVEQGRLWVLQTRIGKRSAVAAVRAAVQMAEEPDCPLTREQAVARVDPEVRAAARKAVLAAAGVAQRGEAVAKGLGASPGRVTGKAVFSSEEAADAGEDEDLVLIRPETSPQDVPGMAVSVGVITGTGGLVSHAAVVARGWGLPAVVGAEDLEITGEGARTRDGRFTIAAGDLVTLDGTTGEIWLGDDPAATDGPATDEEAVLCEHLPELALLEEWAG
ncbi:pyruvate, phosphate dikinase [Pseudonocardia kujensis]|uniref:PEP/pyruvate-binding domain-containing protein n=1 Tax=Pseudonocardia kujensis TaxID=1128675 RepID=UPI001E3F0A62|nr:PEP/pyruvate-binding domain-containing protein [Pseudonocardia kujensis]MCE0761967.1 pyruvate, phosphate dikinase [Pseudonocardia kujensis]